jgi:glycosyltransferase involved in cell wall biosynthesis
MSNVLDLTILIPCLNEEKTIGLCITKAKKFISQNLLNSEILIADNGSTDDSLAIVRSHGVRFISVEDKGYGSALRHGISNSLGKYIIMGDGDDSYDFSKLEDFITKFSLGFDVVIGNRFKGRIEKGAMPLLHKYLGNPVLSFLGRLFFKVPCGDFHCGLRGFKKESILDLKLSSNGMEFASEMLIKASLLNLKITEVPVVLSKDGRNRPPHLRTWRDGWRHLKLLLMYAPNWLFLYPGIMLLAIGLSLILLLVNGPVFICNFIELSVHSFLFACMFLILGSQNLSFYVLINNANNLGDNHKSIKIISFDQIVILSTLLFLVGTYGIFYSISIWEISEFGHLIFGELIKIISISFTSVIISTQILLTTFLSSALMLNRKIEA